MHIIRLLLAAILILAAPPAMAKPVEHDRGTILIFSHTTGFRHDSIPAGIAAVRKIAEARGLKVVASEDPAMFDPGRLAKFRVVVLLSSTTDPKKPESEWLVGARRTAFQQLVQVLMHLYQRPSSVVADEPLRRGVVRHQGVFNAAVRDVRKQRPEHADRPALSVDQCCGREAPAQGDFRGNFKLHDGFSDGKFRYTGG